MIIIKNIAINSNDKNIVNTEIAVEKRARFKPRKPSMIEYVNPLINSERSSVYNVNDFSPSAAYQSIIMRRHENGRPFGVDFFEQLDNFRFRFGV